MGGQSGKHQPVLHDAQEEAIPSQWAAVVYEPESDEQPFVDERNNNCPGVTSVSAHEIPLCTRVTDNVQFVADQ